MKKADISMEEIVKILLAIIILFALVYIIIFLRGAENEKLASLKAIFRGIG